jgi:hypothetical protein
MEGGSLAVSAGANPMIFGPIWSSCMHKCILLLVLRFKQFRDMTTPTKREKKKVTRTRMQHIFETSFRVYLKYLFSIFLFLSTMRYTIQ